MTFDEMLLDDIDELIFDTDDGFAVKIKNLTGGIEIPAIVRRLGDPESLKGGVAAFANVAVKLADIANIKPMWEFEFDDLVWLYVRTIEQSKHLALILLRTKEGMACV